MEILTKVELKLKYDEIFNKINTGSIFIHPTDTIYGIGCKATDEKSVSKIRTLKERPDMPFSIWAPSIAWIRHNCIINKEAENWLSKLPGPYTLILQLKNKNAIAKSVNLGKDTVGIRIPNHWFNEVVEELNVPIVTTSVNKSGTTFMTKIENLDKDLEISTDFMIYEGEKDARPSKIIDLVKGTVTKR